MSLDPASLDRLEALARPYFPNGMKVEYSLRLKDGSEVRSSDRADLELFPLHHKKERVKFEVGFREASGKYSSASVAYEFRGFSAGASAYASQVDRITDISSAMKSYLEGNRLWYSWLYWNHITLGWCVGITCSIISTTLFFALKSSAYSAAFGALSWASYAYCAVILLCRVTLFDKIVLRFGEEAIRQKTLAGARRIVFGGILLAVVLVIVGGGAAGFFTGYFGRTFTQH